MTTIEKAQSDLDKIIEDYYSRNEDGGNYEERYVIACRVAAKYNLDPIELEQLNF